MGARVYNPETNQFTSKDPIKGGNENTYTYPNDPINGSDFSGLVKLDDWDLLAIEITLNLAAAKLTLRFCKTKTCLAGLSFLSALLSNVIKQKIDLAFGPASKISNAKFNWAELGFTAVASSISGAVMREIFSDKLVRDQLRALNLYEPIKIAIESLIVEGLKARWSKIREMPSKPFAPAPKWKGIPL
jgi:hypothetical protein